MGIAPVLGAVVGIAGTASQMGAQSQQAAAQQQALEEQKKQKELEMKLANEMYGYQTQSVAYQSALKQQVGDITTAAAIQSAELSRQSLLLDQINYQTNLNTNVGNAQIKESAANQQAYNQQAEVGYNVAGAEADANQTLLQVVGNNVSQRAGQAQDTLANQANTQTGVRSQVATQEGLMAGVANVTTDSQHALELGRVQQQAASGIAAANSGFEQAAAQGTFTQQFGTAEMNADLLTASQEVAQTQNTVNDLGYQLDAVGQQNFLDIQKELGDSTAMAQIAAMQYQQQALAASAQANMMNGVLSMAQQGIGLMSGMSQPSGTAPNYYPDTQPNNLSYNNSSLYTPAPYSPAPAPTYGSYSSGTVMTPISMSPSTGLFSGGIGGTSGGMVGAGVGLA